MLRLRQPVHGPGSILRVALKFWNSFCLRSFVDAVPPPDGCPFGVLINPDRSPRATRRRPRYEHVVRRKTPIVSAELPRPDLIVEIYRLSFLFIVSISNKPCLKCYFYSKYIDSIQLSDDSSLNYCQLAVSVVRIPEHRLVRYLRLSPVVLSVP